MDKTVDEGLVRIRSSRKRTNILREPEFATIEFLCKIMPSFVTPDMLSAIGFLGSVIAAASVYLAIYNKYFLFLIIPGMAIQWFGDSLDGRIAYYRNTPRKWYGWLLDMNLDWISTAMMTAAYVIYLHDTPLVALLFMAMYGQTFILALMRYKITDIYLIDADGLLGPTELRIILTVSTAMEFFIPGFLFWFGVAGIAILFVINGVDFYKLVQLANSKDDEERAKKASQQ